MGFPFLNSSPRKRDQIVVVELSKRGARAVQLRRTGKTLCLGELHLVNYWLEEASSGENGLSRERLTARLKSVRRAFGGEGRELVVMIGTEDSVLRNIEVPLAERGELRQMFKLNAQHFFKQEMSDIVFDCFVPGAKIAAGGASNKSGKPANVLVGTMKRQLLEDLEFAAKRAGVVVAYVTLSQTGVANAALLATPGAAHKDSLALLHVDVDTSTISFLSDGTLALTRVIDIGSAHLSGPLAEAYRIPDGVAEEFRASILKSNLEKALAPLAHEARAAIDFFEDLHSKRVVAGYMTGDLAQSNLIIEMLQVLDIPCERLNSTVFLDIVVPAEKRAEIEKNLPRLDAAIGAGAGWLNPDGIDLNLLAEQVDEARLRRRDPVRWAAVAGVCVVSLLLLWSGFLKLQSSRADAELKKDRTEQTSLEEAAKEATVNRGKAGEVERTASALDQHATNRFLWALPLDALQFAMVDKIQVVGLKIEQTLVRTEPAKTTKTLAAKLVETKEQIVMSITAKNFADTETEDKFIERLASLPYFTNNLRKKDPVILKKRLPRQVDSLDPAIAFTLLTIECVYPERVLGYEYTIERKTR